MQRCHFCGYVFPENARFCGNCGRAPTSGTALDTASPTFASSPDEFASTIATSPFQQGYQTAWEDEEEQRRRGAIPPLPIPFWTEGYSAAGQAPMVQGTPSFNSVPTIQGTPTGMAGSAPPSTVVGPTPSSPYAAHHWATANFDLNHRPDKPANATLCSDNWHTKSSYLNMNILRNNTIFTTNIINIMFIQIPIKSVLPPNRLPEVLQRPSLSSPLV
jgi:hypothetical protein